MAVIELTLQQLREAIIQLPASQRQKLLKDIESVPTAEQARESARGIRGGFRMSDAQRQRMSALLVKGNDATLSAAESRELDRLVDQFEERTLGLARKLARSGGKST